jgi:hypothetical protein
MRLRVGAALAFACAALLVIPATGSAATGRPKPAWLTSSLLQQIRAAGAQGMSVGDERLNTECPGVQGAGVSAGGCIVAPAGCTANFIFASGGNQYVGTARHCVNRIGEEVTMQVDSTTLAVVGTVSHMTSGEGVPGNDWSLIKIDPAVAAKWGVTPSIPVVGGPNGVYTGCDVGTPLVHYGHGYGVAVAQGKVEGGVSTNWYNDGFGWAGFGAPGDSGSGVLTAADRQAVGDFTHLVVDTGDYLGSDLAGTRITKMMSQFGVSLVNADGSLTAPGATTHC